jgi:N-acetylmuramoyl-L-alanine amidase
MFVNHWDVCLSSESCASVLNKRGLSVHFLIDNDGTIFQMLDTQHKAWHAGIPNYEGGNTKGVGVEISNAYYPKYQSWYKTNGFGERPIQNHGYVHGATLDPFLDFYPVQLEALKALWGAMHDGLSIPLVYPTDSNGNIETSVHTACERGEFHGICNHYNFIKSKIDCAGLDLPSLLQELIKP